MGKYTMKKPKDDSEICDFSLNKMGFSRKFLEYGDKEYSKQDFVIYFDAEKKQYKVLLSLAENTEFVFEYLINNLNDLKKIYGNIDTGAIQSVARPHRKSYERARKRKLQENARKIIARKRKIRR